MSKPARSLTAPQLSLEELDAAAGGMGPFEYTGRLVGGVGGWVGSLYVPYAGPFLFASGVGLLAGREVGGRLMRPLDSYFQTEGATPEKGGATGADPGTMMGLAPSSNHDADLAPGALPLPEARSLATEPPPPNSGSEPSRAPNDEVSSFAAPQLPDAPPSAAPTEERLDVAASEPASRDEFTARPAAEEVTAPADPERAPLVETPAAETPELAA